MNMKWFKKEVESDIFDSTLTVQEPIASYEAMSDVLEDIHSRIFFGKLQPLIDDIEITDINCNSHSTWVNHIHEGQ